MPATGCKLSTHRVSTCSFCSLHLASALPTRNMFDSLPFSGKQPTKSPLKLICPLPTTALSSALGRNPQTIHMHWIHSSHLLTTLQPVKCALLPPPHWRSPLTTLPDFPVVKPKGHFKHLHCVPSDNRDPFHNSSLSRVPSYTIEDCETKSY